MSIVNLPLLIGVGAFASILLITFALAGRKPRQPVMRRAKGGRVSRVRESMSDYLKQRMNRTEIEQLLEESGNPKRWNEDDYLREQVMNAFVVAAVIAVFPIVLLMILGVSPIVGVLFGLAVAPLGAYIGYGAPKRKLRKESVLRVQDATLQLPSLLVTTSAALRSGSAVREALAEGTREMRPGTLKGELDLVSVNLDNGAPFIDAMRGLRERLPSPLIDEAAQKLTDSLRTGVNAADSLVALSVKATKEAEAVRRVQIQQAKLKIMAIAMILLAPAVGIFMLYPIVSETISQLGSLS